ncbi:hypothetical protein FA95DRAFT_1613516 [Auriscalpium vulgare]|uniref:Uncharacterized protein n=1 Tax=Auriscalpium vulgare TaxID=40419 RepID=A0ACB8R2E6_9AGAM|nr:hypothetical protein FA95DRAFT_1613516 [Auriscalpium vulgare]
MAAGLKYWALMGDGRRIHLEYDAIHTRAACVLPMAIESDLNIDDDVRVPGRARARATISVDASDGFRDYGEDS